MFDYDWFHRGGLKRLTEEALRRCVTKKFPSSPGEGAPDAREYRNSLSTRTILYMKDGLTYEMKEIADLEVSSALAFECVPVDENYKAGAIVIVAPFEDIARVEVFAVHPDDKPEDNLKIPGFRVTGDAGRE